MCRIPPSNLSIESIFIAVALQTIYTEMFYMIPFPSPIREVSRSIDTQETERHRQDWRRCLINVLIESITFIILK